MSLIIVLSAVIGGIILTMAAILIMILCRCSLKKRNQKVAEFYMSTSGVALEVSARVR